MRILRGAVGDLLVVGGVAMLVYGGVLAAVMTPDGGEPYYVEGAVLCFGGLAVTAFGLWVAGADVDWRGD